jgi:hypothetical protein
MALPRRFSLWAPVVLWAAVIAFSAIPSLGTDLGVWDTILRKCARDRVRVLAILLFRALGSELPAFSGLACAISDEIHQHFVSGRHASPIVVRSTGPACSSGSSPRLWTPSRST